MSQIYPDYAYNNPIQRGEIFLSTYIGEGYLEKLRPVVVIQNNLGNKHSRSIIVAAITSKPKKELPVNVVIDPNKYDLEVDNCTIMANQIFTIDKDYLRFKKGCLDAEDLGRLDEALKASFDLKSREGKEMNEIQKVFNYQGSQVRTVIKNGESWFVAKDICDILEIRTSDVRTILENDEVSTFNPNVDIIDIGMERVVNPHTIGKSVTFVEAGRGGKDMLIVSEAGLYSLVLKSRKPEAKAFKRWITHEVIPQIRKTGSYSVQPQSIEDLIIMQAQSVKELKAKVNQLEDTQKTIKETIVYRPDNWRNEINKMFDRVARANENRYRDMRAESYRILEERAQCDLEKRLDNLKKRKREAGATATEVNRTNKIEVIEADQRLREIYTAIIKELVIKYVA